MTLLIIAGDYEQARNYAKGARLPPNKWRYVGGSEQLMGMRGARYVVVGTARQRDDYHKLMELVRVYEMRMP